jgi:hypothetical protein
LPGNFENGSTEIWDFVNHARPLFKTMKAACEECERHKRLWTKATQCTGIRAIRELFGKEPICIPKWVFNKLNRNVVAILMDISARVKIDDKAEMGPVPEPEPELPSEPTKRRKRRTMKSKIITPDTTPDTTLETKEPGKRKQRSDKGKKHGSRALKPNDVIMKASTETSTETSIETSIKTGEPGKKKRKQRNDKGKKRGPRTKTMPYLSQVVVPVLSSLVGEIESGKKKRKQRNDKGKKRGPRIKKPEGNNGTN